MEKSDLERISQEYPGESAKGNYARWLLDEFPSGNFDLEALLQDRKAMVADAYHSPNPAKSRNWYQSQVEMLESLAQ